MDVTTTWVFLAAAGCVPAALGIHTLATGRIIILSKRRRAKLRPRPYGLSQLLMGLCLVLRPLSSVVTSPLSALYYVVLFASVGCLVAALCFLMAAMIPQDPP
ncbi:hypothetical protein [Nonomuraea wenchangensis]|uniref:Uncharacterized protein n=1 Tax=Nonomuraea wenchangensis TaxID=568860 RepID=A0A1I0LLH8_9ACTN|nr:hypothetical protein [Nonomuraea wenchangensis]SEU41600.1 hypothetical protein SAMN05421811_11984 [Nonomuraea wenchangensis]